MPLCTEVPNVISTVTRYLSTVETAFCFPLLIPEFCTKENSE